MTAASIAIDALIHYNLRSLAVCVDLTPWALARIAKLGRNTQILQIIQLRLQQVLLHLESELGQGSFR